ncbi:MAG: hypothetical protein ABSG42_01465 [Nitrospirota bacterium]
MKKEKNGETENKRSTEELLRNQKPEIRESQKSAGREVKPAEKMTNLISQTARTLLVAGAARFSQQLRMTHRLGNLQGKFHPSKSRKGIRRSE